MFLKSLSLENYRNYPKKDFFFGETTLIVGPNTAGKTNLLEAIYLLCFGKSFKADKDSETITWKESFARIRGFSAPLQLSQPSPLVSVDLEIFIERQDNLLSKKTFKVNQVARSKKSFIQNLSGVLFKPQDLELLDGSPSFRRNFLNEVAVSADPTLASVISQYELVVRQRNKLLERIREGFERKESLSFWNSRLLELAEPIERSREEFCDFCNVSLPKFGQNFNILASSTPSGPSAPSISYATKPLNTSTLSVLEPREIPAAQTLHGPHKADFKILLNGKDMSCYGSRGQQRTLVLGLKLIQLEYIAQKIGKRPLLLLDDIFSELDQESRRAVTSLIGKQQTFITATEEKDFTENESTETKKIYLP